jgi:hypothetical protein
LLNRNDAAKRTELIEFLTDDSDITRERFARLFFSSISPLPWSSVVLYLKDEFILSLGPEARRLLVQLAWRRQRDTQETDSMLRHVPRGREMMKATAQAFVRLSEKVIKGEAPCLVPYWQAPETLNGTDFIANLLHYLKEDAVSSPLVLVPGTIANLGDWGIIPIRRLIGSQDLDATKADTRDLSDLCKQFPRTLRSPDSTSNACLIRDASDLPTWIPPELRDQIERESNATKLPRLLIPSIYVRIPESGK